tara:strand:- start:968 stop:1342 length:375 start_codon:yes stop_codon:yes gene_type:complete
LIEETQKKIFHYLNKKKIENFVGVPDSTLKYFIDESLKSNNIIIATREEEGIGVGMCLSKSNTLVFMQNAGFTNSISTITSLVQLYEIPIIFLLIKISTSKERSKQVSWKPKTIRDKVTKSLQK